MLRNAPCFVPGPVKIKNLYSHAEWKECNWRKILAVKNIFAGLSGAKVDMTDLCWGRCFFVNQGEQLIFGLPLATLLMHYAKHHGKSDPKDVSDSDIGVLANHFKGIPVQD